MSRNEKAWKFKRALLQKEEPRRAKTLSNVMFLWDLLSDANKTSEGKVVFNFGIWLRHMKTKNCRVTVTEFISGFWHGRSFIGICVSALAWFESYLRDDLTLLVFGVLGVLGLSRFLEHTKCLRGLCRDCIYQGSYMYFFRPGIYFIPRRLVTSSNGITFLR